MQEEEQPTRQELLESLRHLSDDELVARVKSLAARERRATALLVAHLAELDTRDLHLRAGYSSLFIYCREVLALSEHEAYNRMEAARTARRFPLVLDLLAEGAVNLTTVRLLGPHLTADNHARVLESARGKRKAEVEGIVARLRPAPMYRPRSGSCPSGRLSPSHPSARARRPLRRRLLRRVPRRLGPRAYPFRPAVLAASQRTFARQPSRCGSPFTTFRPR
jgi:hypothetical protein